MRNNGSPCWSGWEPGLASALPLAGVGCSEALAAQHVTKSLVGQREESLPSEAGEVVGLFRKLVSSSQAGRGVPCSVAELGPTWACLWLLVQHLGTLLLVVWIALSRGVSPPCLHVIDTDPVESFCCFLALLPVVVSKKAALVIQPGWSPRADPGWGRSSLFLSLDPPQSSHCAAMASDAVVPGRWRVDEAVVTDVGSLVPQAHCRLSGSRVPPALSPLWCRCLLLLVGL